MKPIFQLEKDFFEKRTGIKLPNGCWRDGSKIYLNADTETLIVNFKVDRGQIHIKKNKINEVLDKYENKTWKQEVEENNDRLNMLFDESVEKTKEFILANPNHELRPSHSGGKDSDVMWCVLQKSFEDLGITDYTIDFMNSTNETAQTYLHIKQDLPQDHLQINNPPKGWYQWLAEDKNYYLPSIMVRNCCSTYKEGRVKKVLDKNKDYIMFLGARRQESNKRAEYSWDLNKRMNELYEKTKKDKYKLIVPKNWLRFLPIVEWSDKEVWLYILREDLKINEQYYMGFNRVGCLLCPYASDYTDLIIQEFYPFLWNRWCDMVEKNYDMWNVEKRLKWTKEEYIQFGKWKQSTSKESEYITKNPTIERVKAVAEMKGCSEEIAKKYFKQNCSCGKKLNPDETAMYLKIYGRYEGKDDNRTYLCKKCVCEQLNWTKDEYGEKVREFRSQGCNLF